MGGGWLSRWCSGFASGRYIFLGASRSCSRTQICFFLHRFLVFFFQNSIVTGGFWISGWPWCLQFWRLRRSQDAQSAAPTSGCAGSSEKPNSTYFGVRKNASDIPTNFVSAIQKTMIITPFCPDKNSGRFSNLFRDFLEKPGTLLAQASSQSQRSDAKPQLFFEEKTNQPSKP